MMTMQIVIDDSGDSDGSDAIEASEESSWLNTRSARPSGQEVNTGEKGRASKQRTITSLLPKLPLGEACVMHPQAGVSPGLQHDTQALSLFICGWHALSDQRHPPPPLACWPRPRSILSGVGTNSHHE